MGFRKSSELCKCGKSVGEHSEKQARECYNNTYS